MKARMPCSACKAHGKTSYGHWHGDVTCPYYGQKSEKPTTKPADKAVLAVTEAELTDSKDSFDVNMVDVRHGHQSPCCPWRYLLREDSCWGAMGQEAPEVPSSEEGAGLPRRRGEAIPLWWLAAGDVLVRHALPHLIRGAQKNVIVRASIVDQDVPLLMSRAVMQRMGAIMNLPDNVWNSARSKPRLNCGKLLEDPCGFEIDHKGAIFNGVVPWEEMVEDESELRILPAQAKPTSRTFGDRLENDHWRRLRRYEIIANDAPMCSSCQIPMQEKKNRLTGEGFWGCRTFPTCRQTLPLTYGGRDTARVQEELEARKNGAPGTMIFRTFATSSLYPSRHRGRRPRGPTSRPRGTQARPMARGWRFHRTRSWRRPGSSTPISPRTRSR